MLKKTITSLITKIAHRCFLEDGSVKRKQTYLLLNKHLKRDPLLFEKKYVYYRLIDFGLLNK